MTLRVRIGPDVLTAIEAFLTARGAHGAEGTGVVACHPGNSGWWEAALFVAPDQHATVGRFGCSVTVTERGKSELAAASPPDHLYLVRVHSHPGEAFHSDTDDANPALTHDGALSVVVPYFGLGLRRGLDACAAYRLMNGEWVELPGGQGRSQWLVQVDA
jgi:hypothetical protein